MTPDEIDQVLARASESAAPDSTALEESKQQILGRLRPVRPLAPRWVHFAGFLAVFGVVTLLGGASAGLHGWRALSAAERAAIFAVLIGAACFAAAACTREMRPASGLGISRAVFAAGAVALWTLFAMLFHDYGMARFAEQGLPCLVAGLTFAVPAALVGLFLLRRGYLLNAAAAGLALGTLAGLAGVGGLELHCPNLKASHILAWHVGVLIVSGLLLQAVLGRRRGR